MSDPSDLFGPIDGLPAELLPERLEFGAEEGTYGALRHASAAWLRGSGAGDAFGRALVEIEPLLGRSYLLGQPNLAGMGVAPWDLAQPMTSSPVADPLSRARRMVGAGMLGDLLDEDLEEDDEPEDPGALARGADLLEAMQRLNSAAIDLPEGAPDAVHDHLQTLRADLADRLRRERRQTPALDRALRGQSLSNSDAVARLRRPAARPDTAPDLSTVMAERPQSMLVDDALETVVAKDQPWPQPLGEAPEMVASATKGEQTGKPGGAQLGQLARIVSNETGKPIGELLAEALAGEKPKAPRKDKGSAGATASGGISIDHVHVDGLAGGDPALASILQTALQALPDILERTLAARGGPGILEDRTARVDLTLGLTATDAPATVARRMAERIVREGARRVGTLHLGVDASAPVKRETPRSLLTRLAGADDEGIARALSSERRILDGTVRDRLARFFGEDFRDVLVFAGPMAGALARSLSAEAVTHGNMVFFDPKHFRLDTAQGEALVAHELAHTRQDDDRDPRMKEAEALRTEAAYLDWIQPGGMPLVEDDPLEPLAPSAAGADGAAGMFAAKDDRQLAQKAGPRAEQAEHELRLEQVMSRVRELLAEDTHAEANRYGRLTGLRRLRLW
jgi:hypothetical protein